MKCIIVALAGAAAILTGAGIAGAQTADWKDGGPGYIYVNPVRKSPFHMPYDETLKCIDCHKWNGADAYTAATMTLQKSTKGRLPQEEIKKAILNTLKGTGDYREMYVMATSFKNEPWQVALSLSLTPKRLLLSPRRKSRPRSCSTLRQTAGHRWCM